LGIATLKTLGQHIRLRRKPLNVLSKKRRLSGSLKRLTGALREML